MTRMYTCKKTREWSQPVSLVFSSWSLGLGIWWCQAPRNAHLCGIEEIIPVVSTTNFSYNNVYLHFWPFKNELGCSRANTRGWHGLCVSTIIHNMIENHETCITRFVSSRLATTRVGVRLQQCPHPPSTWWSLTNISNNNYNYMCMIQHDRMMIMSINTSLYTVKRVNHQVLPQLPGPADLLMYQNAARPW